jgi:hypothetical protein
MADGRVNAIKDCLITFVITVILGTLALFMVGLGTFALFRLELDNWIMVFWRALAGD